MISLERPKKTLRSKFAMGQIIQVVLVLVVIGILGTIGIYIDEKVSDKAALASGDTYYNASTDVVAAVETGFDFVEIVIMAVMAGIIILVIFTYLPIRL